MGIPFSCPLATYGDLEDGLDSIVVKSISLGDEEVKTTQRSISFKGQDSEPKIIKSLGSGRMLVEGSISLKLREKERMVSINISAIEKKEDTLNRSVSSKSIDMDNQSPGSDGICGKVSQSPIMDLGNPKHEAALKLQKVYKSFRTRRKLADCAVLVEQSWWKLLDFAELKHSSVSFFDIEHHETAFSRWSRAKTRAAKVGKGLCKNDKARKLALQHWLEAIDPRHRYGHNLRFYYVKWLQSQSREPFFYWLDIGEGKEVNLVDKCPRSTLQQQCIKYLGPMERKAYEVAVENAKLKYRQTGEILDTTTEPHSKWIFVLSTSKALYVGKKKKGKFQHSSFLAGGATSAAGRLVVENGILKAVWPHSGHYKPTPENFQDFISYLKENNVDLTDVKMDPVDEDERSSGKQRSGRHLRCNSSEEDLIQESCLETDDTNREDLNEDEIDTADRVSAAALEKASSRSSHSPSIKLTKLEIPKQNDLSGRMLRENCNFWQSIMEDLNDGEESASKAAVGSEHNEALKQDLSDEEDEENREETVSEESILQRINSHKETKSYQLGKKLSCKWSTGAGPRIGCVRDYPWKLQFHALEQVNLSPRSKSQMKSLVSPGYMMRSSPRASALKLIVSQRSTHLSGAQCTPVYRSKTFI
ncbi:hypothetical protein Ancab_024769 [Ancistrocladus abbreviatus]